MIFVFDAVHDQVEPDAVLTRICGAPVPGGLLFMREPRAADTLAGNLANPMAPVLYSVSNLHCMTVSLAHGGAGIGTVFGEQRAGKMLADAGLAEPEVQPALRAVSAAADLSGVDQLAPPQREMVAGLIRMCLRQAQGLVDDPGRAPGWTFTDPDILAGWGRGSMMVPGALASAPELTGIRSFLDVGTGIGLLAIAAARTWPEARSPASMSGACPAASRSLRPGGWLVLGRMMPPPDPLAIPASSWAPHPQARYGWHTDGDG